MHQLGIRKKEAIEDNSTTTDDNTDTTSATKEESNKNITTSESEGLQDWEIELQKELEVIHYYSVFPKRKYFLLSFLYINLY